MFRPKWLRTMDPRTKRQVGLLSSGALSVVAVAVLLLAPMALWSSTRVDIVDQDFDGVFSDADDELVPAGGEAKRPGKTIRLLVVHGIGRHCIGYADSLATGIARQWNMTYDQTSEHLFDEEDHCANPIADYNQFETKQLDLCDAIRKSGETDRNCQYLRLQTFFRDPTTGLRVPNPFFPGYLRTQDYRVADGSGGNTKLRLYELTWDPATRWAKSLYVERHDNEFNVDREFVNRNLKRQIINESISDAVLYLGRYRPVMLYPIAMAFCKMMTDSVSEVLVPEEVPDPAGAEAIFDCNLKGLLEAANQGVELSEENEVIIITHSLGSRMTFDALGAIAGEDFLGRARESLRALGEIDVSHLGTGGADTAKTDRLAAQFQGLIRKIFVLSNQVPLLELGDVKNPTSFNIERPDLGERFAQFLHQRTSRNDGARPLQFVSFTDPNDLLSYNLKCWYYLHVLKHHTDMQRYWSRDGFLYRKYFDRCTVPTEGKALYQYIIEHQRIWKAAAEERRNAENTPHGTAPSEAMAPTDPARTVARYWADAANRAIEAARLREAAAEMTAEAAILRVEASRRSAELARLRADAAQQPEGAMASQIEAAEKRAVAARRKAAAAEELAAEATLQADAVEETVIAAQTDAQVAQSKAAEELHSHPNGQECIEELDTDEAWPWIRPEDYLRHQMETRRCFWRSAQDLVSITDVSAYLEGLGYPLIFANPTSAHSQYFVDEKIFRLIACGATSEKVEPKECATN